MNETINNKTKKGHPLGKILLIVCVVILGLFFISFYIYITSDTAVHFYNSAARSDLRNVVTAQEAYYINHHRFTDSIDDLLGLDYGLLLSNDVVIRVISIGKDDFSILAFHMKGDRIYVTTWSDKEIEVYKKSNDKIPY